MPNLEIKSLNFVFNWTKKVKRINIKVWERLDLLPEKEKMTTGRRALVSCVFFEAENRLSRGARLFSWPNA